MTVIRDRYTLDEPIGSGGMGDVFRGRDIHTGKTVAIKMLRAKLLAAGSHHLERFVREGEMLRELNHPNIVQVIDTVQQDEHHYIVMEYVAGGSLRDLLDTQPEMPVEHVISLALDIADALTRVHRLDIIHRDLKPANVLIGEDGVARLTDFGIAHLTKQSHITGEGMLVGTLRYLPPEAITGQQVDARADIWAFGVMLFEMLTGIYPFERYLLSETLAAIVREPVPDLEARRPDIPAALVDLVYRMVEKERAARIPSVLCWPNCSSDRF